MRVSAIADWTTCEAMALSDPRPEARVHVAAWVGTLAHARLLEQPEPDWWTQRLRFDSITATDHNAHIQAKAIATEALLILTAQGWTIMETEREMSHQNVTGHLDILAWHGETMQTAIIDLKTGRGIGAGWLQVGGYIQMLGDEAGRWPAVDSGGILHVPRVAVSKEPKATLEVRNAADLARVWRTAKSRIDLVLRGAQALRSPGQHCGRCAANCPVRI